MVAQNPSGQNTHLPSTTLNFRPLDTEALEQIQYVLSEVEAGKGVLVRLADLMGGAVGQAAKMGMQGIALVPGLQEKLHKISEFSLNQAFSIAILGMKKREKRQRSIMKENVAQAAVAVSGAMGGFGGIFSMAPDISFTTLTIMREIAAVAVENGENLEEEDTRRACLEVFALSSLVTGSKEKSEKELGFFAARALMRGQPLVLLMAEVAGHYGLSVSRTFAAKMVPVAGALCGASLNTAFLAHYRAVARAHFTIRRLERTYGASVREAAETCRGGESGAV
ncbi:EcsC family protein [Acetobacteraceae bacterium ESL0709]|nr:EcsC family protein [Acetobacteraceae bacterium ESL0697]MDF7677570.1 EcsC family protein [Acetobacteraceae bacterium ESL0709]